MSQGRIDRRRVLTFGAATALGAWSGFGTASARPLKDQQPDPVNGEDLRFTVMIPGLPEVSRNIREIAIDELKIDPPQTMGRDQELWGRDHEFWQIGPGSVHFGSARFTIVPTPASSKELQAWWAEAAKGKNIRKMITVTLKSDKTERSFGLVGCLPTAYSTLNFDTSSTVQTETLTVKIGRIEFKT